MDFHFGAQETFALLYAFAGVFSLCPLTVRGESVVLKLF